MKGKRNRIIWKAGFGLIFALFGGVAVFDVAFADSSDYSIPDIEIIVEEQSEITISINSSKTKTYYGLTLYFPMSEQEESTHFALDQISVGGGITPSTMDKNTGIVYWADLSLAGKEIASGNAIASAKYTVSSNVVPGVYNIPVRVSAINASSDDENFTLTAKVTVEEVPKEDSPEPPEMTAGLEILEGSKLSDLGSRTLGFSWVDANETVRVGQNTYRATYTYNNDKKHYTTISINVPVYGIPKEDSPEPPEMTAGLKIAEGSKLSELGSRTTGFSWVNANETVTAGQKTYRATYTYNNDTQHYKTLNLDVPVYGLKYVSVSVTVDGEGGYNAPSLDRILEGSEVQVSFAAAEGYHLSKVTKDGVDVTNSLVNNTLKFTVGTSNISITVVFTDIKYSFEIIGNNVTTDPSGIFEVFHGADQSIIITTKHGYRLTSVKVNGVEKIQDLVGNTIVVHDIKEDTVVIATAEKITYEFIRGDGQKIALDEDVDAVFEIDADSSLFKQGGELYVDGALVDEKYYTISGTTTTITISLDYLNTLEDGAHILTAIFGDGGVAIATFNTEGVEVPNTGDSTLETNGNSSSKLLPIALVILGSCVVLFNLKKHRIKFEKKY